MITLEALRNRSSGIAVVGLGYAGTPLLSALQSHFSVYGYDCDERRIRELRMGVDHTRSVTGRKLEASSACLTSDPTVLKRCGFVIVTVPTPLAPDQRTPDLGPLQTAARAIGRNLSPGAVIVVESTVYPGVTEEVVGKIIAGESALEAGTGFHLGYSPERINPGDALHTLERITKVVAGENRAVTELMSAVYGTVNGGLVHQAANIRTAEAAKVFENVQRDVNIALMNELAMICHRLGVDTTEVIRSAGTKWNFVQFEPGLVGGHCIGVDSYYLTHAAEEAGYSPRVIPAGRVINDSMSQYVAESTAALIRSHQDIETPVRVLVLGVAFKENVPDVRSSRVVDLINALEYRQIACSIFDPVVNARDVREQFGLDLIDDVDGDAPYDAIIVAVKHDVFAETFSVSRLRDLTVAAGPVLVDVKSAYDRCAARAAGFSYWCL